ncbi:MAG TPA: sigma-70 family RNA polymerase sigma factor [Bryobacteraceae bacterium]|jgi:RNA polymerase sigma factor (sigma-70 family)|nr:sigma-70 family RNA polymerase sigma factor [Bryobacteraceae bacterium]
MNSPADVPAEGVETQPWASIVQRIQANEPSGMEELYKVFTTGIRFHLCRQLGPQDLDDRVHDAFLTIAQSIRRGDLREPERLMGYVRTVVRRQVAGYIGIAMSARRTLVDPDHAILRDRKPDPERKAIEEQNNELAMRVLNTLPLRDREVLVRFYLQEQSPSQICRDMRLTATQFRLTKSRAKARFTELGLARFSRRHGFQAAAPERRREASPVS